MRRTQSLVKVAKAMLDSPDEPHYGYELSKACGVRSGAMYPLLRRLLDAGWITDGWEDPRTIAGRPPRRFYRLTPEGRDLLQALVATSAP